MTKWCEIAPPSHQEFPLTNIRSYLYARLSCHSCTAWGLCIAANTCISNLSSAALVYASPGTGCTGNGRQTGMVPARPATVAKQVWYRLHRQRSPHIGMHLINNNSNSVSLLCGYQSIQVQFISSDQINLFKLVHSRG